MRNGRGQPSRAILAKATVFGWCLTLSAPCIAQEAATSSSVTLDPAQLFAFADRARDRGEFASAEAAYRALASDPDVELRTEARFRLALMLADRLGRHRDAAVLLRQILDEKPDAARVRIELARMQAEMGNLAAAERELRAAQASELPTAVEQLIRFYAAALNSRRLHGLTFELALAPDSNINRATRSETLGTIIGNLDLDKDAREQSGIGLSARAHLWGRRKLTPDVDLLARINASGDFYKTSAFHDYAVSVEVGPQLVSGADRLSLAAVTSWRWFGRRPYAFSRGGNASFQRPLGPRAQLRVDASALRTDDRLNALRDADRYALAVAVDRAFSPRSGGGARVSGQREVASDTGYSTISGGVNIYLFRELAQTTVVASGGYSHLGADQRLLLYRARRVDHRLTASLSGTVRALRVGSLAPIVRLHFERNFSAVEIFDYHRLAADIGVTAAL